ncbi:MAG TPA: hypothetical protein VJ783_02090 [Pirellulales bacterium]|nr:hypothetical protein [Pirellulales bacterium]
MTAAVATILAAVGWFTGGWASGVEWSPDRFAHRSFRFYVMFGGSDPDLTPSAAIQRREWESDLETWLKQNGYVIETPAEPRWFLSKGFAPGIRGWSGPAKRVCQELGCWGGRSHNWIEWSEAHPDIAAELWPDFVKLVREVNGRGMDAASFLLDNARDSKSQKEYRAAADRLIEMHARGLDP